MTTMLDYGTDTGSLYSTPQLTPEELGALVSGNFGSSSMPTILEYCTETTPLQSTPQPAAAAKQATGYSGSPPTPPASPISHQDEVDGWISTTLIYAVKTALLHLFNIASLKHLKETCYGNGSPEPATEEDYYQIHFHCITQRLLTQRFIPALQNLLRQQHIQAEEPIVKIIAETFT